MFSYRHRMKSAVAGSAAALAALAMSAPSPVWAQDEGVTSFNTSSNRAGPQWQANEDDFLFLQLRIKQYRLTFDVRGYQTDSGVCLDLADVIQSLDLPIRLDKKSRRATGWLFEEDQTFTIDRDSDTVQTVNNGSGRGRAPLANDIYDTPEGWCVDTRALSRWFGIDFTPDLYNSTILLETERDLPFMQAMERKSRAARLRDKKPATFDLSQYPTADMEYKPWRTPSVDVVARIGGRTGGITSQQTTRVELFAAGEALGASYSARLATNENLAPQALRVRAFRNDPQGGLLGPLAATQLAAGDVETLAGRLTGQTAVGRGAFVSNRPLDRAQRFSATSLRGVLPTGWDAELYRNGQLIAFQTDRADGRYEFLEIDLFFGRNDLEVVLYGPQGQIRREKTTIPVGFNQIEPGQTFYWAGIVQNNRDLIQLDDEFLAVDQKWRWGVGVERGLDKRTSAMVGAQSLFFNGERRTYAEAALSRTLGSLQLELAGAHEFGAGSVAELNALGQIGNFNFGADALVTFGDFQSEFANDQIDHRVGFNFDTSLRFGKIRVPVQGVLSRGRRRDGTKVNRALTTASIQAGRTALSVQLDHQSDVQDDPDDDGGGSPGRDETRIRLLANTRFRDLRLRGNATFQAYGPQAGLESVDVRMDMDLDEVSELQGQFQYIAPSDEVRLTAGYTRRFDQLSLRGNAFVTSRGEVGANVQVAFSLGPNPSGGGIRVTQNKLARSGQAAVTVFRDDDGNGRRDPGEELRKDVMVEAGLRSTEAVTGENGRTIVDDLNPFRPVLVSVDETTLGDPFLAPAVKGIVVTPRPGIVAQIELPISPSGEVDGVLLSPSGVEQPGVKLELISPDGLVSGTTVTEFDGFFLFERVPYGRYQMRVAAEAAAKLDVEAAIPAPKGAAAIEVKRGSDLVRMGPVKLRREGEAAGPVAPPIAARSSPTTANPAVKPRDGPQEAPPEFPPQGPPDDQPPKPAIARKVAAFKPPEGAD